LKEFIYQFDFVHMRPDSTVIAGGLPGKARSHVLSEPGKQYAVYIVDDTLDNLELTLPRGTYTTEWMNSLTGKIEKQETLSHSGGKMIISAPGFTPDMALRIVNSARGKSSLWSFDLCFFL
jgi:hypothetical protein